MRRLAAPFAWFFLVVLGAAPAARPLAAQGYFGQTAVQYKTFDWRVLRTEHFDVHYYPEIEQAARYAGQMAERSYARLKPVLNHEFRERKPIIVYGSRGEFAQNNVFGDPGEGTGGATDALRQRNMFFFTGDMGAAEHVLTHEMVHVFQYDIFARGRAGSGLQTLNQVNPPLWYMEGMADYLATGPHDPHTDAVLRDAALNGNIPSIEQMTTRPDIFFPYRFGQSLWQYVGRRWGDEVIGEIMQATPGLGVDRAFRRYTGLDLEDLGEEWKEDVQQRFLPQVATLERPRKVAQAVLNPRRTGGIIPVYIAPVLSPDASRIAYISTGSLLRAEVFLDLYLADANTGKRIRRLTKSTLDPEYEELRYGYSQGAFSPDGRYFAFTAQRKGKDVLYVYDMRREPTMRQARSWFITRVSRRCWGRPGPPTGDRSSSAARRAASRTSTSSTRTGATCGSSPTTRSVTSNRSGHPTVATSRSRPSGGRRPTTRPSASATGASRRSTCRPTRSRCSQTRTRTT